VSRIGKKPIEIPKGVKVSIEGSKITVDGPKGQLHRNLVAGVSIGVKDDVLTVERANDDRQSRANQGLIRALVANMVQGVHAGFERVLEISGVGYKAELAGNVLQLNLGYSHRIDFPVPKEVDIVVDNPTRVVVRGIDKELVGQTAASIRAMKRPDPYKAKGVTYEGERILRKAGKKAIS
jgi:large subunit ribosomal protein L6